MELPEANELYNMLTGTEMGSIFKAGEARAEKNEAYLIEDFKRKITISAIALEYMKDGSSATKADKEARQHEKYLEQIKKIAAAKRELDLAAAKHRQKQDRKEYCQDQIRLHQSAMKNR